MADDLIRVIDKRAAKQAERAPEGIIIAVGKVTATVRPLGSSQLIPCAYDAQQGVAVNKRCTYRFVKGRNKYVIQSVYGNATSVVSPDQNPASFELSPPSNLTSSLVLAGWVLLSWFCPPQQDITFEVQTNSVADEAGATLVTRTRAGQYLFAVSGTIYYRVRSVTPDWRFSSWTPWAQGASS